jgi:hypothetical protein
MKGLVPKLQQAMLLDPALLRPFLYCHTTWRDTATPPSPRVDGPFGSLVRAGNGGSCPGSPDEQEVAEHAQQYEDLETVQRLKIWLKGSLRRDSDGYVLNDPEVTA